MSDLGLALWPQAFMQKEINSGEDKPFMNRRNFTWNVLPDYLELEDQFVSKCIIGKIYVSGEAFSESEEDMRSLGITHVVSVTGFEAENPQYETFAGIRYHRITGVHDDPSSDLTPHIKPTLDIVDSLQEGEKLLIHCQMGVSRSASLAIACLMHADIRLNMEEAYDIVKEARPQIAPEPEFLFQIKEYFDTLRIPKKVRDLYDNFDPLAELANQPVYITRKSYIETCNACKSEVRMMPGGGGLCECPFKVVAHRNGIVTIGQNPDNWKLKDDDKSPQDELEK